MADPGDKTKYWKELEEKYGKGVHNRQIYIDLLDKEMGDSTLIQNMWVGGEYQNLPEELSQLQAEYKALKSQEQKTLEQFDKEIEQGDLVHPFSKQDEIYNKFRKYYGKDSLYAKNKETAGGFMALYNIPAEIRDEYWNYRENLTGEINNKVYNLHEQFSAHPESKRKYEQSATTWRQLLDERNDISDKELLYASLMDEGADVFTDRYKGGERSLYSGYGAFGLDSIGERLNEFERRGFIDKDFRNRIVLTNETNEKGEKRISGDFTNLNDVLTAKSAFVKSGKQSVLKKARELGVTLSPTAMDYFTVASYNLGESGTRKMLEKYHEARILDNDKFMEDNSYPDYRQPHGFAKRRVQAINMLRGEQVLSKSLGTTQGTKK